MLSLQCKYEKTTKMNQYHGEIDYHGNAEFLMQLSRNDILDHTCRLNSSDSLVESLVGETEAFVVDAEEVKNGGIEIPDVHGFLRFADVPAVVVS